MVALVDSVADKFKGLFCPRSDDTNRCNPIEILKRLHREAFSDITKLRDRQDKVERVLSFYKPPKGSFINESSTRVSGDVDISGALCFSDINQQTCDAIERAGITTGVHSKITFETSIREKDTLMTEFVLSVKNEDDILHSPLSLAKVFYAANVSDWFSVVAVPVGAHCRDVGIDTQAHQKSLTNYSSWELPLLKQYNGSAVGLMVKRLNIIASLAQFMNGSGPDGLTPSFSTFGQVMCQVTKNTKLSLFGIHQTPKLSAQRGVNLGGVTIPLHIPRARKFFETPLETSSSNEEIPSTGSIAMTVETELDESSRIGGWVEMQKSNVQWSLYRSDSPEGEVGCGFIMGGIVQEPNESKNCNHFQAEAFWSFNLGQKFKLQPAIVYVKDAKTQFHTLMLRSSWSF